MHSAIQKFCDHLVETGKIDKKSLYNSIEQSLASQKYLPGILVDSGFITKKDKLEALRQVDPSLLSNESEMLVRCPPQALIDTQTMVLAEIGSELWVSSMSDQYDIEKRLSQYYEGFEIKQAPVDPEMLDDYLFSLESSADGGEELLERFISEAVSESASDLHIHPKESSFAVRIRVDGDLVHRHEGPLNSYKNLATIIKARCGLDEVEKRKPQDGGFSTRYLNRNIDFRVSTLPSVFGEKISIRIQDPESVKVKVKDIGLTRYSEWKKGIGHRKGINFIAGRTGAGKTRTLNASVWELDNFFERAVYSLEHPVEFRNPYITQVDINNLTGMDFATGLRSVVRMDCDVIIIGEIRDRETAEIAIQAAESGHMVIATLHAGGIVEVLQRIRDLGIDPNDIKGLVRSVLVQDLVATVCPECVGDGCQACGGSGRKGRTLISEVHHFESPEDVMKAVSGEVMWPTITEDLIQKHETGLIDRDSVMAMGTTAREALEQHENNKNTEASHG